MRALHGTRVPPVSLRRGCTCGLQDSGVNLEEEESRMVAGRDRSAAAHMPLPQEKLCINPDPFNQKVRLAVSATAGPVLPQQAAVALLHAVMRVMLRALSVA